MTVTASDAGGPDQDEVERITNLIIADFGTVDLETALTVVCNLAGQLICSLAEGRPSGIQAHGDSVAENIKKAAITLMLHQDSERRKMN